MAWSGGTFTRNNGVFTGSEVWTNDKNSGYKIRADHHDTHDQDLADGIDNCLTKDGSNTPTANIPMGGYVFTGVGNASSRTHFASAGQVQDSSLIWAGSTGGTANALTASITPTPSALVSGMMVAFKATYTNTGAATLNLNGIGAKNIKKINAPFSSVIDIEAGDIGERQIVIVVYDASITAWQLVTVSNTGWASWTPTYGAGGSMTFTSVTTNYAKYKRNGNTIFYSISATGTTGGTADPRITFTLPVTASGTANLMGSVWVTDTGTHTAGFLEPDTNSVMTVRKYDGSNWGLGASKRINVSAFYEVA